MQIKTSWAWFLLNPFGINSWTCPYSESARSRRTWRQSCGWTVPENFNFPLQFYVEEAQEELMFRPPGGQPAPHRGAQADHPIQLERGIATTGLMHIFVIKSSELRQWLFHGTGALRAGPPKAGPRPRDPVAGAEPALDWPPLVIVLDPLGWFLSNRRGRTTSLRPSQACPYQMFGFRCL